MAALTDEQLDLQLTIEAENLTNNINQVSQHEVMYRFCDQVFPLEPHVVISELKQLMIDGKSTETLSLPIRSFDTCKFSTSTKQFVRVIDMLDESGFGEKTLRAVDLNFALALMKILINNLKRETTVQLRTLYYNLRHKFADSDVLVTVEKVTDIVDSLCCYLSCPRSSLCVMANDKASQFVGNIVVRWSDTDSDESLNMTVNVPFPVNYHKIEDIQPTTIPPQFILIVEKHTLFLELCESNFCKTMPCVIVTPGGQPSIDCRLCVKKLYTSLQVPVFVIVDCNPYGVEMYRSFKYGSYKTAFMSRNLLVPFSKIQMIGLFHSEMDDYDINVTQTISNYDRIKAKSLLQQDWIAHEPLISASLIAMGDTSTKADIESFIKEKGVDFWINIYLKKNINDQLQMIGGGD